VSLFRRLLRRLSESDEERLASSVEEWADTVPGTVRIKDAPNRQRVRLAGIVNRISVVPGESAVSLEAVLTDGTGTITAVWTGRRGIPGMMLGTRMVLQGVLSDSGGGRRMVNPAFEFARGGP
jgi:RecG-like helicase